MRLAAHGAKGWRVGVADAVLLVRDGQLVKLERVEPPEFGGNLETLEKMLLDAVKGPHADWTPQDLEDIARCVRERRGCPPTRLQGRPA